MEVLDGIFGYPTSCEIPEMNISRKSGIFESLEIMIKGTENFGKSNIWVWGGFLFPGMWDFSKVSMIVAKSLIFYTNLIFVEICIHKASSDSEIFVDFRR